MGMIVIGMEPLLVPDEIRCGQSERPKTGEPKRWRMAVGNRAFRMLDGSASDAVALQRFRQLVKNR